MNHLYLKRGPFGPFLLLSLFIFSSCSLWRGLNFNDQSRPKVNLSEYVYMSPQDYLDHLNFLGDMYLQSPDVKQVKLSRETSNYMQSLVDQITFSNQTILSKRRDIKIYVIEALTPFHFSTPKGAIFLSAGLLKKYINNENLLAVVLGMELLRSDKDLYGKNTIIPVGYISTERFLSIVRIPFEEKIEMNKWTYYIMRRSGFDADTVLSLIQIKNKNTLDFSLQLGDTKMIAREESLLKAFVVKKTVDNKEKRKINSSRGFYLLNQDLQRVTL